MIRHWRVGMFVVIGSVVMSAAWASGSPTLVQEHFRWRNDDGTEAAATWKAAADTAITGVTRGTNIRLRFGVANTSTSYSGSLAARLEYSTSTSGPWTPVSTANDGTSPFEMTATSGYADGNGTTALLAGSGTFVAGKCVESPNNAGASVTIGISQYSNFEYCFKATAKARGSTTYYFRVGNGSAVLNTYSRYAALTMAAGEANEPPVIVGPLAATGSVINVFSCTIRTSGSEPITYGASGLPAGLTLNGNTITGMPTAVGSFSVPLTATSAWGSDSKTLALTVLDNQPPVASNQTVTVTQGSEVQVNLAWSDPDQPALLQHSFAIVSGPSHGTVQSYNARYNTTNNPNIYYYKADTNYTGPDTITWKCNDGKSDSNVGTVTVTVVGNIAPTANNSSVTVSSGVETSCSLSYSHPDAGQTLTFSLVSQPSHGTAYVPYPNSSAVYYKSAPGYAGPDSFAWRCNDGKDNSNVATVTVTVTASAPVPQNQTVCAAANIAMIFPASYGGGGGYTYTVNKVSNPLHGSVVVTNGTSFRYVPAAGYLGSDSFTWNMTYWNATTPSTNTATVTCWIRVKEAGTDWPTFGADEYRTGVSPMIPPATLNLQWRRDLPSCRQAWPGASDNQIWTGTGSRGMSIDQNYEPIAADGKVFMGSNRDDCMVAYDAATGAELWRAYVDGPIRLAPLYNNGKVYAGSDDSYIYCWDANTGALVWKKQAVSGSGGTKLGRRKVFGNMRMVSQWPVRGGLMMVNGRLYFASGLWTTEGAFVGALNPETGTTLWLNEATVGLEWGMAVSLSPQGYLVRRTADSTTFYVPCGKSPPVVYPLYAGPIIAGLDAGFGSGLAMGTSLEYEWVMLASSTKLDPGVIPLEGNFAKGTTWVVYNNNAETSQQAWPTTIVAGSKTYSASDVTALGVAGTVARIIAANGRLFVLTKGSASSLYCFGGDVQANPAIWPLTTVPLPAPNDTWTTRAARIVSEGGIDDKGLALVLGVGSGRLIDELLLRSSLHLVIADPDTNKVQALRRKLSDAGLHGARASVLTGDPMDCGLPSYIARLIVAEDVAAAGWALGGDFARNVYRSVRPYGGSAWLFTSAGQHTEFAGWVGAMGETNAVVSRDSANEFSVLTRVGALPGSIDWTGKNGPVAHGDRAIHGPLGVLWYGDTTYDYAGGGHWQNTSPDVAGGRLVASTGRSVDAFSGIVLSKTQTIGGARSLAASASVIEETPGLQRRNPLFGLRERGYPFSGSYGGGACTVGNRAQYGSVVSPGSIYKHDIGVLDVPFKARCEGTGVIPANGLVLVAQEEGCGCAQALQTSAAFVHDPDAENWMTYSYHRLGQTLEEVPIVRLGVNFGAPAEYLATNGTLWVRENGNPYNDPYYHATRGFYSTPYEPKTATRYFHHSMRMICSEGPAAVAASGLKGATKIRVPVAWTPVAQWADPAPVVDGNLADACWNGASPTLLNKAGTGNGESWFRYDGSNLYIGAVARSVGGWTVYLSDRVQVTSGGVRKQLKLNIDQNGVTSGTALAWSGFISTNVTTNCTVEIAVPWETLAAAGFEREKLIVNVIGPAAVSIRGDVGYGGVWAGAEGFYVPLQFDSVQGFLGSARPYKVRLHFAETEGALAGERVFDVKLQGQKMISDFDVFTAAGGADRGIVREFTGVSVGNELVVELTPKVGLPVISGVELEGQFALPNQAPVLKKSDWDSFGIGTEMVEPEGDNVSFGWTADGVAVKSGVYTNLSSGCMSAWSGFGSLPFGEHRIKVTANDGHGETGSYEWVYLKTGSNSLPDATFTASQTVGLPGMTVNFDASGSVDTNGSIAGYAWEFSDPPSVSGFGTAGGVATNHTFATAGSYNVRLTVTDNEGATRCANTMIYVIAPPVPMAPTITSPLTATTMAGMSFSYAITASGSTPMTFGASGLPAGLTVNGAYIAGTPMIPGTYSVAVTAGNAYGTDTKTLVLIVESPVVTIINVIPSTAEVRPNTIQQFTATAKDQFGNVIAEQPAFAWSVSGGGTIDASGLFRAGATAGGPHTVTASCSGKSGTAVLIVGDMPSGLAAWWKLDETSGTTAVDAVATNNGTLANGPAWTTGKIGGGLSFDGVDDNVSVSASPYSGVVNSFAIVFWAKPTATRTATTEANNGVSGTSGQRYAIYPTHGDGYYGAGHAGAGVSVGTDGVSVFEHASGYLPSPLVWNVALTGWTHVAVVYSNRTPRLYLNGALARTGVTSTKTVHPGCNMGGSSYGWYKGSLDDVRIYNRALGASEIQTLASPGGGVDADGIPDTWKIQYFGSTSATNAGALVDADGDGMTNLAEYTAGTSPVDPGSRFQVSGFSVQAGAFGLSWQSVTGRLYTAHHCDNLLAGGWGVLAPSNIAGTGGLLQITDTNSPAMRFYRVGVRIQ